MSSLRQMTSPSITSRHEISGKIHHLKSERWFSSSRRESPWRYFQVELELTFSSWMPTKPSNICYQDTTEKHSDLMLRESLNKPSKIWRNLSPRQRLSFFLLARNLKESSKTLSRAKRSVSSWKFKLKWIKIWSSFSQLEWKLLIRKESKKIWKSSLPPLTPEFLFKFSELSHFCPISSYQCNTTPARLVSLILKLKFRDASRRCFVFQVETNTKKEKITGI